MKELGRLIRGKRLQAAHIGEGVRDEQELFVQERQKGASNTRIEGTANWERRSFGFRDMGRKKSLSAFKKRGDAVCPHFLSCGDPGGTWNCVIETGVHRHSKARGFQRALMVVTLDAF
jgi:hypothetical protein